MNMPRQSSCCGEHNTGEQPCEMHLFSEYILNKMSYSADIAHRDNQGSTRSAQSLQYLTCEVKQMLCVAVESSFAPSLLLATAPSDAPRSESCSATAEPGGVSICSASTDAVAASTFGRGTTSVLITGGGAVVDACPISVKAGGRGLSGGRHQISCIVTMH